MYDDFLRMTLEDDIADEIQQMTVNGMIGREYYSCGGRMMYHV